MQLYKNNWGGIQDAYSKIVFINKDMDVIYLKEGKTKTCEAGKSYIDN